MVLINEPIRRYSLPMRQHFGRLAISFDRLPSISYFYCCRWRDPILSPLSHSLLALFFFWNSRQGFLLMSRHPSESIPICRFDWLDRGHHIWNCGFPYMPIYMYNCVLQSGLTRVTYFGLNYERYCCGLLDWLHFGWSSSAMGYRLLYSLFLLYYKHPRCCIFNLFHVNICCFEGKRAVSTFAGMNFSYIRFGGRCDGAAFPYNWTTNKRIG